MFRFLVPALIAATVILSGCESMGSSPASMAKSTFAQDSLVGSITKGTGMTNLQAAGSLGGLVSLGQSRLTPENFAKMTKMLPASDKYLSFAKDAGLLKAPVKDVAGLNDVFADLDVSPEMARGFLGGMSQYFQKTGGDAGRNLFASILTK